VEDASQPVRTHLEAGVLEVTLDRPGKRNAFNRAMMAGVNEALERAERDEAVRVVLLSGNGQDFSAGLDSATFSEGPDPDMSEAGRLIRLFARAPKPIVAGVSGRAVGVGFTLLLHCDWVIVADDSQMSAPFVRLGLTPEAGSTALLPARIGHARAFEILSSARVLSGREAVEWGLFNASTPKDQVDVAARDVAVMLAALPSGPLQATKSLLRDVPRALEVMDREGEVFDAFLADLLRRI
jgi:enoyl-CoA hydratase/carnithine racemase